MVLLTNSILRFAICFTPLLGDLGNGLAAELSDLLGGPELHETVKSCLYAVGGVIGTVALGADILDAGHLEDGTDGTARDNAGTFFSGEEEQTESKMSG